MKQRKNDPINFNSSLAGNLSKSLTLEDKDNWFFNNVLNSVIDKFMNSFGDFDKDMNILSENAPFFLESFWVNFQKENEFNAAHTHNGIYSFVIWLKCPSIATFQFTYPTAIGGLNHLAFNTDSSYENMMILFPAQLLHQVYPFYNSNEERVSISGNIGIHQK